MERRLSTVEARKSFSQLVNATHFKGDHVIIERHGTPMVVLLSIDEYQRLMAAREARFQVYDEIRARNQGKRLEDIEDDVAQAVAAVRQEEDIDK